MSEVNFDGLVGPTHNYAGLSHGNRASTGNAGAVSNPKRAALQGLAKMRFAASLGLPQGVLPPHERPHGPTLRRLGFGDDPAVAVQAAPAAALRMVSSAASMWTANAATVSPSADTVDGRVHFTPANLLANAHRAIEGEQSYRTLNTIFADADHFAVHEPLPATLMFADEGAANHTRLHWANGAEAIELFVYGREGAESLDAGGSFPRRQTREASEAVARLHQVKNAVFLRQSAEAIDSGAFHNDVVAVGNGNVLLYHAHAFDEDPMNLLPTDAICFVPVDGISLDDAVATYLFNSQLLTLHDGSMLLLAPQAVAEAPHVAREVDRILADGSNPIERVQYLDLRESMRNGGGPACLRLRVELNDAEREAISGNVLNPSFDALEVWVERHYRERLQASDLADPAFVRETHDALSELTDMLGLGDLYDFQRTSRGSTADGE